MHPRQRRALEAGTATNRQPQELFMYPLTIGLAIENRDLWEQAQSCLADLPFRIIVEHQDIGDVSNFLDRLERMRPDVVLIDISGWREPLEGLVTFHPRRHRRPDDHCLQQHQRSGLDSGVDAGRNQRVPVSAVARTLCGRRSRGFRGTKRHGLPEPRRAARAFAFFSAKGGCGATTLILTLPRNWAGRTRSTFGRPRPGFRHGRLHHQDKSVYSILDAVTICTASISHIGKRCLPMEFRGSTIVAGAARAGLPNNQIKDEQCGMCWVRPSTLRLDAG